MLLPRFGELRGPGLCGAGEDLDGESAHGCAVHVVVEAKLRADRARSVDLTIQTEDGNIALLRRARCLHDVEAQVDFERKIDATLKAVHHTLV